jgi:hypothetical protein
MNIRNKTHWRTDDIRRYLRACIKHEGLDPKDYWNIEVYYTRRRNNVMGYGWYNSRRFKIGLPRRIKVYRDSGKMADCVHGKWDDKSKGLQVERWTDPSELPESVLRRVIQVAIPEIGHCKDLHDGELVGSQKIDTEWYGDLTPIRKKASAIKKPKAKAVPDLRVASDEVVTRIEALIEKEEKRHARNTKSLRTRLRKAKARARYYQKKEEAA